MKSSLTGINQKIGRAREHLAAVGELLQSYDGGSEIAAEVDANGMLWLTAKLAPVPDSLPILIGDCVHNLRAALDHLVWQLAIANNKTPNASNMFPICNTPQGFQAQLAKDRLQGVYPNARSAIEALQPYSTGSETLQVISFLDNVDKHRTLVVARCLITQQQFTLKHPVMQAVVCYGGTVGTKMRGGEKILGMAAGSFGGGLPIIEGKRDVYVAFDEEPPAKDLEVMTTLSAAVDYVEHSIVPSLKKWLV